MDDFDVLIIGGGAAGMSCALILGSAKKKSCVKGKKVGILLHQKAADLKSAEFYHVLGVTPGTKGSKILKEGPEQLKKLYPQVEQIEKEKVMKISSSESGFMVETNRNSYQAKQLVIATGYSSGMKIKGLEQYVVPHKKSKASKKRVQLENADHVVAPGIYVAGTLAGHRSQFAIACGSGAAVATDILTEWNEGKHVKVHDKA